MTHLSFLLLIATQPSLGGRFALVWPGRGPRDGVAGSIHVGEDLKLSLLNNLQQLSSAAKQHLLGLDLPNASHPAWS